MLTNQGREDVDEDIGERVQKHDQNTGPEQPVAGRGSLKKGFWVLETQTCGGEEGVVVGNRGHNNIASGDEQRCD